MKMMICNGCGDVFADFDADVKTEFDPDARRDLSFLRCPSCLSEEIEEAYQCEQCDEFVAELEPGTDLCIPCAASLECDADHGPGARDQ